MLAYPKSSAIVCQCSSSVTLVGLLAFYVCLLFNPKLESTSSRKKISVAENGDNCYHTDPHLLQDLSDQILI